VRCYDPDGNRLDDLSQAQLVSTIKVLQGDIEMSKYSANLTTDRRVRIHFNKQQTPFAFSSQTIKQLREAICYHLSPKRELGEEDLWPTNDVRTCIACFFFGFGF